MDLAVDTAFVAGKLGKLDWILLDARDADDYNNGHIPGAVNLGRRADIALRDPAEKAYTIVPKIEQTLGDAGIADDKHIIIYGKAADVYRNTVSFWIIEYLGCNSPQLKCTVQYYDGGFERWQDENGKIEKEKTVLPASSFKANIVPSRLATTAQVKAVATRKEKAIIIDTRTEAEYKGYDIRALRGGHIPGARNISVQKNYDSESYRMRPIEELAGLYKDIPKNASVIVHCQTSTRSSYTYLVLRMLGYKHIANYNDSWRVYGSDLSCPVENEQWFDFFQINQAIKELKEIQNSLPHQ
jgi:thiosulfate/3-mercaptopyruvate sulfurtransferase